MVRIEPSGNDQSLGPGTPPRIFTKKGQGNMDVQHYDGTERAGGKVSSLRATGLRAMRGASDEESELDTASKASNTSESDAGDDSASDSLETSSSDDDEKVEVSGFVSIGSSQGIISS